MRTQSLIGLAFLLAAGALVSVKARGATLPPPAYTTLATRRAAITLPAYTAEQKSLVAGQAQLLLRDLYVHRDVKVTTYGKRIDPVTSVARVVADAPALSDAELHAKLERIFFDQHDLHLNYYYPKPHQCYRALLPFSLVEARDPQGRKVIAVQSLAVDIPEVWPLSPGAERIEVGDVLLSVDGVAAFQAAALLAPADGGANQNASRRFSIENLTYRSQKLQALPESDTVTLRFKDRAGEQYTLTLPWISRADLPCLGFSQKKGILPRHVQPKYEASSEYQLEYEQLYKPHRIKARQDRVDTAEPIVHWELLQNDYGKFGYLRLDSFAPEKLSDAQVIDLVAQLVKNELRKTEGLIIDVRDNGGGSIILGEALAQVFTPATMQPQGFRLLTSPTNQYFFATLPDYDPAFGDALRRAARTGARYTEPESITPVLTDNEKGQSYFKPVAVLTNASCYSACDMFTATMQDHGAALIVSEDFQTGGGGANVVEQSYFLSTLADKPGPFAPLPGGQDMRVSWRQTLRSGRSAGKLIEGQGVLADLSVPLSTADFYTQDGVQKRLVSSRLSARAPRYQSSAYWEREGLDDRLDFKAGEPLVFGARIAATDKVTFGPIAGQAVGALAVSAPSAGKDVDLTLPASDAKLGAYEFIGYTGGMRAWRITKHYRIVPESTVLAAGEALRFSFDQADVEPLEVYTQVGDEKQGWSVQNGVLKAGLGDQYPNNLETEASLFLDLAPRASAHLGFKADVQTEEGYDFFSVQVIQGDKRTYLLEPVSGKLGERTFAYDLTPWAGQKIELRFVFTSDAGITERGVSLDDVVLN